VGDKNKSSARKKQLKITVITIFLFPIRKLAAPLKIYFIYHNKKALHSTAHTAVAASSNNDNNFQFSVAVAINCWRSDEREKDEMSRERMFNVVCRF
jgi:hypothetical protein